MKGKAAQVLQKKGTGEMRPKKVSLFKQEHLFKELAAGSDEGIQPLRHIEINKRSVK